MKSTDYREYPEPALVREFIKQLEQEADAQQAEKFLVSRLQLAIAHLQDYSELLDGLYIKSLHDHNLSGRWTASD